jgi:hypothetical protein
MLPITSDVTAAAVTAAAVAIGSKQKQQPFNNH